MVVPRLIFRRSTANSRGKCRTKAFCCVQHRPLFDFQPFSSRCHSAAPSGTLGSEPRDESFSAIPPHAEPEPSFPPNVVIASLTINMAPPQASMRPLNTVQLIRQISTVLSRSSHLQQRRPYPPRFSTAPSRSLSTITWPSLRQAHLNPGSKRSYATGELMDN